MILKESCYYKTKIPHIASETAEKLYYYVQWTGHFICRNDFYIKRNNFKSYLLLYTINGSGTLCYMGREYQIKKNSIVFIDCEKLHEYYPENGGWEFKYIHFYGEGGKKFYDHIKKLYEANVIYGCENFQKYFDRICSMSKISESEETCSELIYRILIELIKNHKSTYDGFDIKDVLDYISENYETDINAEKLAKLFHLSRCYFSTVFKKKTGTSPYRYILNYRLNAAKKFLSDTNETIDEISAKCGFSDTSSFIRAFKKQEKIPPLAYRKNKQPNR